MEETAMRLYKEFEEFLNEYQEKPKQAVVTPEEVCILRFCCKVFQKIYFSVKLRKKTERTE